MEKKNELAVQQPQTTALNIFGSIQDFEDGQRMAKVLSSSNLVPQQYKGNIGDCLIGLNMAARMQADPLMVLQNLVVVHGTPTFEAKFAIACFNATGKYTPIRYTEVGERGKDSYGMYAYAIDKATGDVLKGPEITIGIAKEEGWYARNPKWKSIPQLMLRYRSASWFIRTTDPGVMLGFQTTEEIEDADAVEVSKDTPAEVVYYEDANQEVIDMDTVEAEAEFSPQGATESAQLPPNAEIDKPSAEADKSPQKPKAASKSKTPQVAPRGEAKPLGAQPTPELFK